jgi:hypothetical protein
MIANKKLKHMKQNTTTTQNNSKPKAHQEKKMIKRPENKDNLDSREGEEQQFKGDDITHNEKEVHNKPRKK